MWELKALLPCHTEGVCILRVFEGLRAIRVLEGHLEVSRHAFATWHVSYHGSLGACSKGRAGARTGRTMRPS